MVRFHPRLLIARSVPVAGKSLPLAGAAGTIRCHPLQSTSVTVRSTAMPLTVSLPPVDPRPANPPEIRPAKVFPWLDGR